MINLQDQKIMHQYFTDMLFRPLADALVESVEPEPVAETQTQVELLPLPTNVHPGLDAIDAHPEVVDEQFENDTPTTESLPQNNPWLNYQWENEHPPWAQDRFDCLLFDVCGFSFAVPLTTLGQIQLVDNNLSPVFGQAPWFMGIQATPIGKLRVVNTAQYVMPERYQPRADYRPTYVISIADCNWALAVDTVNQPISLAPGDVKWRANRARQSWLAGVVKKEMCVLIDIPALARQLMETDKNSD